MRCTAYGRVREGAYPRAHRRGTDAGEGKRQEPWAAAQDERAPEERSACATREGGGTDGDRQELQCQRGDDFTIDGMTRGKLCRFS
jgi:hypothetical protein